MIGVVVACWFVSRGVKDESGVRRERVPFLHLVDLMVLTAPVGIFFGRIANFINGELLGKIVAMPGQPAPWWAVKFPQELLSGHDPGNPKLNLMTPEAARARDEALGNVLAQVRLPSDGHEQAVHRLIEKIQHGSHELGSQLEPLISARAPSQLLQAAAEGILIGTIVWLIWRRPRTPGVITAWGLILYGVLRICTEFVRLPDAGLEPVLGLSRGQWLSVPMVVGGAILLAFVVKRNGQKLGGWGTRKNPETA
jgi:phosphatidylglycerol:prolipoprotein diacylglycerol transferase